MTPNPHDLINLPGAGNAEKELLEAGLWDDTKMIDGETEFEFTVKVFGSYHPGIETQAYTVIATNEEDAMVMAEELSDFDEIEDCKIEKMREATE